MTQYRKKPIVIEAIQFNGLNPTQIKNFVGENCEVEIYYNEVRHPFVRIFIHTLEGDMEVSNGDYVIKGVKGEFYPCKPDIFEQTYEFVEIHQNQQEVELNEETIINEFHVIEDKCFNEGIEGWQREKLIANHFYELGLNARK